MRKKYEQRFDWKLNKTSLVLFKKRKKNWKVLAKRKIEKKLKKMDNPERGVLCVDQRKIFLKKVFFKFIQRSTVKVQEPKIREQSSGI